MKKILVSNLCGIGDVIRMEPLIRGIRKKYQNAYIGFLTREARDVVFQKHLGVDDIFVFPDEKCNRRIQEGDESMKVVRDEIFTFIKCLQEIKFDLAVMPPHQSDALLTRLISPKEYYGVSINQEGEQVIIGEGAKRFDDIMKMEPRQRQEQSTDNFTDLMLDICRELNLSVTTEEKGPRFHLSNYERTFAQEFFAVNQIQDEDSLIVFNFNSRSPDRMWKTERIVDLANFCVEKLGIRILFSGSEFEYDHFIAEILSEIPEKNRPKLAVGTSTLLEYAALIEKANLLVTVDSAAMHIADCVETPIIALFGEGTYFYEARPYRGNGKVIAKKRMEDIEVGEVFEAIQEVIRVG